MLAFYIEAQKSSHILELNPMTEPSGGHSRTNPFWDFSLRLYSSPAVQRACLELQDGSGVDVNVMLYALWQASMGRSLSNGDGLTILAAVEPWREEVVVPLRTARRNLKGAFTAFDASAAESLRAIVKKAELEAERQQQQALYNLRLPAEGAPQRDAATLRERAVTNLEAYASGLGRPLSPAPVGVMLDALEAAAVKP